MDENSKKLRKYLLGSLPATEATELDLQLIAGDDLAEALTHAEQELVEDHLDHLLTAEEEELFQQNFLVSEERRQLVRETSLLRRYSDKFSGSHVTVSEPATSLIDRLRALFFRPAFAGAALVAVLLGIGLVWQVFLRDVSTSVEREYAALNQRDLSNPEEISSYSSISLAPTTLRDTNSTTRQNTTALSETLLVRLALPAGEKAESFKAVILKGSSSVFSIPSVRSYQNPSGREVRLLLPRSALENGQFLIRLERPGADSALTYQIVTH